MHRFLRKVNVRKHLLSSVSADLNLEIFPKELTKPDTMVTDQ